MVRSVCFMCSVCFGSVHYPKNLWWTSLISLACTLSHLRISYGSLARLRRITIYIQVVEKSWSMWTPNSILKYTIVIIFMASLFWKIPKLTLNFWWYSFKYCAKTEVAHRNSEMTIFRPNISGSFPLKPYLHCQDRGSHAFIVKTSPAMLSLPRRAATLFLTPHSWDSTEINHKDV